MIPAELQDAYQKLVHEVWAPPFFDKLAQHGIVPRSQEEAAALVDLAGIIQNARAEEQLAKQAQSPSPLVSLVEELKGQLAQKYNLPGSSSVEQLAQKTASQYCQNNELVEAADAWGQFLQSTLASR